MTHKLIIEIEIPIDHWDIMNRKVNKETAGNLSIQEHIEFVIANKLEKSGYGKCLVTNTQYWDK